MVAYPDCTLQMKMLSPGWPIIVHDTHTRRKRRVIRPGSLRLQTALEIAEAVS